MGPLGEAAGAAAAGAGLGDRLGVLLLGVLPLPPVVVVVVVLPLSLLHSSLRRVAVKGDGNWLGLGILGSLAGEGFGLLGRLGTPTPPGRTVRIGEEVRMKGEPKPAGLNGLNADGSRSMSACDKAS